MMFDTTRPVRRWLRSQLPPPQPRFVGPGFWQRWDWLILGLGVLLICAVLSWRLER